MKLRAIRARNKRRGWPLAKMRNRGYVSTVRDGNWSDPSVWSDRKVPGMRAKVWIRHNVDLLGVHTYQPGAVLLGRSR